jgi:hypothetical protein
MVVKVFARQLMHSLLGSGSSNCRNQRDFVDHAKL